VHFLATRAWSRSRLRRLDGKGSEPRHDCVGVVFDDFRRRLGQEFRLAFGAAAIEVKFLPSVWRDRAGDVAARMREAFDQAIADGIGGGGDDSRDLRGRALCRKRLDVAADHDDIDLLPRILGRDLAARAIAPST
jgi:hypothetical protein